MDEYDKLLSHKGGRQVGSMHFSIDAGAIDDDEVPTFKNIQVGPFITCDVTIWPAEKQPNEAVASSASAWAIHLDFETVHDPMGCAGGKDRNISGMLSVYNNFEDLLQARTISKSMHSRASTVHLPVIFKEGTLRAQNVRNIAVDVRIIEPQKTNNDVDPVRHHIKKQINMYENSKTHGDIKLVVHGDEKETEYDSVTESVRKRKRIMQKKDKDGILGIDDGENDSGCRHDPIEPIVIKTYSAVLRAASVVFDSILTVHAKEKISNTIEIHGASAQDVDDMMFCDT